ncbi:hypothetical protein [Mycobacteroides abscessus]|uniref:hypothetical protein n=1 Tax=Mycobacteroides abscessus TaxID=36809 RepID=UPI000927FAC1|nr:hypothetical protein [Mycobacteroides abscessus]SHQ45913.1 Uncharacterised protein [Mycobacteroides abscessus subsp. abscessus]SKQ87331.1 Uncharacterised protein [Mycobacteroides abscessus subsp. massiliense]SLC52056.1 Uncharacterised protein [Mycobacteroides abscessus subsp. massiliense]
MSLPTGVLSYSAAQGIQAGLQSLNAELLGLSGATMATGAGVGELMGSEGASIVSSFQALANHFGWGTMFDLGLGFMQMDTVANIAHVAEVQACDEASQAVVQAVDLAGLVLR